jgi:hypothetical protein
MIEQKPTWCVVPAMSNPEMTETAVSDLLAQTVPVKVLLILQGVEENFRDRFLKIAEQEPRLLVWSHDPTLPSLSATWNCGLEAAWTAGAEEALVVNNDVRLGSETIWWLTDARRRTEALFVTAVGVTESQFTAAWPDSRLGTSQIDLAKRGGPDFSCFLISKEGHEKYPFDEDFVPAYGEDCDTHRRYMLSGDGDKIFSINLPYWHIGGGSQTLKSMSQEARAKKERQIDQSRAYYQKKWGGGVNQERYTIPFDHETDQDGVTTPDLQRAILGAGHVPASTHA